MNGFFVSAAIAFASLIAWPSPVLSQDYPSRPIRILVGFSPGGGADLIGRTFALRLSESLGQPVVVENRPGANGNLSAELAATLPADGHTILVLTGAHTISQSLYTSLRYNLERDFAPVAYVGRVSLVLVVNPSTKIASFQEFLSGARARPGALHYGTSGNGSAEHLAGAMLEQMADVKITHVPFKGGSDAMAALLGGHIAASITTPATANSYIKSGQLVPLAVTTATRTKQLPDVPAIAETDGLRGYELTTLYGIVVRSGTPKAILDRLNIAINKALAHPDTMKTFDKVMVEPTGGSPEEFGAVIKESVRRFGRVANTANLKLD